jgi:hypothetical protein
MQSARAVSDGITNAPGNIAEIDAVQHPVPHQVTLGLLLAADFWLRRHACMLSTIRNA